MRSCAIIIIVILAHIVRDLSQGHARRRLRRGEGRGLPQPTRLFRALLSRAVQDHRRAAGRCIPIGFLFGLGFDTATEVGLFALAATVPIAASLPLIVVPAPLLFTAGMSLADTTDGVMMLGAYGWAFVKPVRKLFYNISITLISVLVAVVIGTIEVLSIIGGQFNLEGPVWDFVGAVGDIPATSARESSPFSS